MSKHRSRSASPKRNTKHSLWRIRGAPSAGQQAMLDVAEYASLLKREKHLKNEKWSVKLSLETVQAAIGETSEETIANARKFKMDAGPYEKIGKSKNKKLTAIASCGCAQFERITRDNIVWDEGSLRCKTHRGPLDV